MRRLAEELVVNPNTVAKAYGQMERDGLVVTRQGAGTFVSDPALREVDARDLNLLIERMDVIIGRGLTLGMGPEELTELFRQRLSRFGHADEGETGASSASKAGPGTDDGGE